MRKDGVSGKKIIDALVANSASFIQKTPFSQEKYMRKKQKKYAPRIILRRPSARSICEAYFATDPHKIGFCRMDTLALSYVLAMLGRILILESLRGLITAAVAERVGGHGSICSTYYTVKRPPLDMVRLLNIDEPTAKSVLRARIVTLISARKKLADSFHLTKELTKFDGFEEAKISKVTIDVCEDSTVLTLPTTTTAKAGTSLQGDVTQSNEGEVTTSCISGLRCMDGGQDSVNNVSAEARMGDAEQSLDVRSNSSFNEDKIKVARPGMEASSGDIHRWASQGFTSLLVAAPELDPWTVAEQLLPLLSSSSPFVIYHSYHQPLAECMHQLQINNMAVASQLSEPWSREYQVLPSRTHPHMQMCASGGYALSGIHLVSCE